IVDKFNIKQQHRWFVWQTDNFPIPQGELEISCTNIHIIPSTEEVDDIINDVIRGNIIKLNGKLVNVKDYESNFTWETSTERNDTGGGACEILWVEKISILQ
ncbi:MAG: hypothetical protein KDC90_16645, partial [Ignavibacteriae bacterium]|nr:hypothetical protein [Ignavibacteriota bacterium]